MADQILPFVYMLGILLLVISAFLQSNSKLKQFLTNLAIWIVIIFIILSIIVFSLLLSANLCAHEEDFHNEHHSYDKNYSYEY